MQPRLNDLRPISHEYVSVKEAAMRAKLTPRTIYMWIRAGKIQSFGHGHGTRVLMGEVLAPRKPKSPKVVKRRSLKPKPEMRSDNSNEGATAAPEFPPTGRSLVGFTIPERAEPVVDRRPIGSDNAD